MIQTKSIESSLWDRFEKAARLKRRDPYELLHEYMQECLEKWEDQRLDEEIGKQARASGKKTKDAAKRH